MTSLTLRVNYPRNHPDGYIEEEIANKFKQLIEWMNNNCPNSYKKILIKSEDV